MRTGAQVNNRLQSWFQGEWRGGKMNGYGVMNSSQGNYQGEWRDGKPHGSGQFKSTTGGDTLNGTWIDGCFSSGNRKIMIGNEHCP
jgi:hypothetical protein